MSEPQMSKNVNGSGFSTDSLSSRSTGSDSMTMNEEDIDPFTYRPPLTKWDYLKVSLNDYIGATSLVPRPHLQGGKGSGELGQNPWACAEEFPRANQIALSHD